MNGWRDSTLGEEIELAYGKALAAHTREAGDFNVFGSNGIVGTHAIACVDGPGIVIGRKGSVGEVRYSKAAFWPIDTTYFVVNKEGHDWRFLYHLLKHADLTTLNSHSAVPGLNREDAYSVAVRLPPRAAEPDISKVLDFLERALLLEDRAVENSKALKATSMVELFSRGLRSEAQKKTEVGLIPTTWEAVPLGSLGRVGNGSTPKRTVSAYWIGGTYPWLNSSKVYDRNITKGDQFVTETALRECYLPKVQPGALLMAITGQGKTLGHCAILRTEATVSQHVAYVQTDTARANPVFLRGYLETQYEYLRQVGAGGGSTKGALTCAFLRSMPVPLPPLAEQNEIAGILDAIDAKIGLHQQKRAVLEELFKALLNKLMTGEIDVNDLDLSALQPAT